MSNDKIVLLILIQRESNCVTKLFRKMKFIKKISLHAVIETLQKEFFNNAERREKKVLKEI